MDDKLFGIDENTGLKWTHLETFKWILKIKTDSLLKLVKNQDSGLEIEKEYLKKQLQNDEKLQSMPNHIKEQYRHQFYSDIEMVISDLEQTQRKGAIITIISLFEVTLKELCDCIDKEFHYKIKQGDLTGKGIEKSILYLKKVYEVDFEKFKSKYDNLKPYRTARNIFAHSGGSFLDIKRKKEVEAGNGLTVKEYAEGYHLKIDNSDTLLKLIVDIQLIIEDIIFAIDKRYEQLKNNN